MLRVWLPTLLLIGALACTPSVPLGGPPDSSREVAPGPSADEALLTASAAMGQLKTLRERVSTRTYRNDEPFLAVDAERAYVAPDRRYERMEGRSPVDNVAGETVQIGARFFKRVGDAATWQHFPWTESVVWPAAEYSFAGARNVSDDGTGEVDGRAARILVLQHEGSAEGKNAGWQFHTRLWIDPKTHHFLRRETRGMREEPDPLTGKPLLQRYEGSWTYMDHNGAIGISEPTGATGAP
jgi:hypothetical protein